MINKLNKKYYDIMFQEEHFETSVVMMNWSSSLSKRSERLNRTRFFYLDEAEPVTYEDIVDLFELENE